MDAPWRRNFYILLAAELFAIIGFQAVQPFLPYYIQEFDVADLAEALVWAGYMGTAGGVAMAISSPIWGALADRFGRKSMVVRSMLGGGLTMLFMAYATSVEQLLVARALQGVLAGTVTACLTLISTTTPKQHLGFALGMMQGTFMLGASLGPLLGGPFIEHFGYFNCFLVSGAMVLVAGVAVQFWVREDFHPEERPRGADGGSESFAQGALRLLRMRAFLIMLVCMTLVQFAFGMIMLVVPLFLQQLAGGGDILTLAGLIFALMGLVGAISSAVMGRWSEYFGARQTLLGGLVATSFFLVAQGLSTSVAILGTLMVLTGLATGAIRPVTSSIIARIVAEEDRGKAFGIVTSATAFGWALGPTVGGYMGATLGFRPVFFATAVLFAAIATWAWRAMEGIELEEPKRRDWRVEVRRRLAQRRERKD
jgi:DHA1 family multidrug resistance protein-like MFS transporter